MADDNTPKPPAPHAAPRWRRDLWPLYRQMLRFGSDPILVGPWTSEVGFEVLYWLPWLAKVRADLGLPADQIIPISRGGAAGWYGAPKGLELYDMRSPQDVRVQQRLQHQRVGSVKQYTITPFDRSVLADAAHTLGLGRRYRVLHPAWMYQALSPFWTMQQGIKALLAQTTYADLAVPTLSDVTLPEHFVAVRFYFRPTFPFTQPNVQFAKEAIRQLASQQQVIILNSGLSLDDHLDYIPKDVPNVVVLADRIPLTAANNLLVQSAVLAKADAFVGTYGGMSQLALRLKKPTVSVFDDWHSTALAHKHLSEALALMLGIPFTVLSTRILPQLQAALPRVTLDGEKPLADEPVLV